MFHRTSIAFAALLLLQAPIATVQAAPSEASQQSLAAGIDALIAPHIKPGGAGVTVIATRDGKTVFRKAYGMADIDAKQALRPESTLRLGSITKQVTAIAILMLADEGKLAVTDDITRFLPSYPTGGKKITIEHLLTHTSGIPSFTSKPDFRTVMHEDATVQRVIDYFKNDPVEFEPGSIFKYNNSGYFLLGAIIEKASGMPYARFVEERMFKPLGMTQSGYEGASARLTPVTGYSHKDGIAQPAKPISMTWPYSAGALVSTVDDLARWQAGLTSGKLVKPATLARAHTAYTLSDGKPNPQGYGWFIGKLQGSPMIFHGGNIDGFATDALWLPKERVYVAVLSNAEAGGALPSVEKLSRQVARAVVGKSLPQPSNATLDDATRASYVGVYPVNDTFRHMVRNEKGVLSIQGTNMPRAPLVHYKADGFLIGEYPMTVQFARDAKGQVSGMTITSDEGEETLKRTLTVVPERPTVKVAASVIDQYVGRYPMAPDLVIEVKREGDTLHAGPVGQASVEMAAIAPDTFYASEFDAELRFEKQADGSMKVVFARGPVKLNGQRAL